MKLYSTILMPAYRFLPGKNTHPHKVGGHGWGRELESKKFQQSLFDRDDLLEHEVFFQAIDLFNTGHYWESHVALEALWNGVKRIGADAAFFKAIIMMDAAGIKARQGMEEAKQGHLDRSLELLKSIPISKGKYKNVDLADCLNFLIKDKENYINEKLNEEEIFFPFKIILEP